MKVIEDNIINDKVRESLICVLKDQIKKLDINKLEQKKTSKNSHDSVSYKSEISNKSKNKCVNKNCTFIGLNPNNKAAVGTCSRCGLHEHFSCGGLSQSHKEDISNGVIKFFCSLCFAKNPSIANSKTTNDYTRPRLESLPIVAQGYMLKKFCTSSKSLPRNRAQESVESNSNEDTKR